MYWNKEEEDRLIEMFYNGTPYSIISKSIGRSIDSVKHRLKKLNLRKLSAKVEYCCARCGEKIYRKPSEIKRSKTGKFFCSRSCAAKHNNSKHPKRTLKRKCNRVGCDSVVKSHKHTMCVFHWTEYKESLVRDKTLGEYRRRESVKGKHPSWSNVHIRQFARSQHSDLLDKPCQRCGYDKHVELCHIRSVSSFPDDTLIRVVNARDNIVQLCPNCHWEFDSGLFKIGDIV